MNSNNKISYIGLIAAFLLVVCMFLLWSFEQVDQLVVRLELAEQQLEVMKDSQAQQEELLQNAISAGEMRNLKLDQIESQGLNRDFRIAWIGQRLVLVEHDVMAAHSCFLVNDFAQSAEDLCSETGDPYYCNAWAIFEDACMNVDEEGNWVELPNPGVYHRLISLYTKMKIAN